MKYDFPFKTWAVVTLGVCLVIGLSIRYEKIKEIKIKKCEMMYD